MTHPNPTLSAEKIYEKAKKLFLSQKFSEAEIQIADAITLDQANSDYWGLLGKIWYGQNRFDECKDALTMALQLNVNNEDALETMGNLAFKTAPLEGLAWYERAYDVQKNNLGLAKKLAQFYFHHEIYPKSVYYCHEYNKLKPDDMSILNLMGAAFYQMGDRIRALDVFSKMVRKNPDNINAKSSLVQCYQFYEHNEFVPAARTVILSCLRTEKLAHRLLSRPWASLIWTDPALEPFRRFKNEAHSKDLDIIPNLKDEFLLIGLQNVYLSNAQTEIILQNIRRDLLLNWDFYKDHASELIPFLKSLGLVCWYNEFAFYIQANEKESLLTLQNNIQNLIEQGTELSNEQAAQFCLLASYVPLLSLGTSVASVKLTNKQNQELKPLLKAQIKDPLREIEIGKTIQGFTSISDETSLAVRAMYEGRPYPRWRAVSAIDVPADIIQKAKDIDLLVAGCGTGHEPMQYAMSAPSLNITAIDLSIASMSYGMRMAEEYGVKSINFRHGDLMKVADLNKKFDIITSSGVLHHLKEPEKGLEPLVKILKQGGRMSISLYSQYARDLILNPAADYIVQKGYTKSEDDIRAFRRDLMQLPDGDPRKMCMSSTDFYSLSECTDLLFHVQEHRYTFPKIRAMVEKFGLELHHVMVESPIIKAYNEMFPDDREQLNWDHWDEFEQKNPTTFAGMYKTWLKFKGDTSVHPLDPIIKIGLL